MGCLNLLLALFLLLIFFIAASVCYIGGLGLVALIFYVLFLIVLYKTVKKLFSRKG